jgi:hypothetical protein
MAEPLVDPPAENDSSVLRLRDLDDEPGRAGEHPSARGRPVRRLDHRERRAELDSAVGTESARQVCQNHPARLEDRGELTSASHASGHARSSQRPGGSWAWAARARSSSAGVVDPVAAASPISDRVAGRVMGASGGRVSSERLTGPAAVGRSGSRPGGASARCRAEPRSGRVEHTPGSGKSSTSAGGSVDSGCSGSGPFLSPRSASRKSIASGGKSSPLSSPIERAGRMPISSSSERPVSYQDGSSWSGAGRTQPPQARTIWLLNGPSNQRYRPPTEGPPFPTALSFFIIRRRGEHWGSRGERTAASMSRVTSGGRQSCSS